MRRVDVQVAIFGAGAAGLWLASELNAAGVDFVLVEELAVGGGQSVQSQGILHSGARYALEDTPRPRLTEALGQAQAAWRQALAGIGPIDISASRVLAPTINYLLPGSLIPDRAEALAQLDRQPGGNGVAPGPEFVCYASAEPVLDMRNLAETLVARLGDSVVAGRWTPLDIRLGARDRLVAVNVLTEAGPLEICAQAFVFLAGGANRHVAETLSADGVLAQERPLTMQIVRGDLPEFFGHILDSTGRAALTVTSHEAVDSSRVWYVGGRLASAPSAQAPGATLRTVMSGVAPQARIASVEPFHCARYEPRQAQGLLPSGVGLTAGPGWLIGWPTKFTLAPTLSWAILRRLSIERAIRPRVGPQRNRDVAKFPWQASALATSEALP